MRWNIQAVLAYALLACLSTSRAHAADSGFYLGVGYGKGQTEVETANPGGAGTLDFNVDANSWRGFLGYRTRALPVLDFAGELGWVDYRNASQVLAGHTLQVRVRGAQAAGLAILPLGPFDLFGKAGGFSWSADKNFDGAAASSSGTNPFYGLGVGFHADKVGVRAEWERYNVSAVTRLQTYSLSVYFRFY